MAPKLNYAIRFVADMDAAIKFHRDVLGFPVKFESPGWSELLSGETTLALHQADAAHPAGSVQVGICVPDLRAFHTQLTAIGVRFTRQPELEHGRLLAELLDPEGARVSLSEERKKSP